MTQQRLWTETVRPRDEVDALLALSLVPGVGPGRIRSMLAHFGSAMNVFAAPRAAFRGVPGVGQGTAAAVAKFSNWANIDEQRQRAVEVGAELVVAGSDAFPALLSEIFDPPSFLWVRGDPSGLDRPSVAIVGTRRASEYGKRMAFRLAHDLAAAGLVVVSGLAYGIDAEAHRGALDAGGRTIAVLGSGVDVIYPHRHMDLAEQIISGGVVVSEFPPGAKPDAPNFPRRNRIVSGLTLGTIVVEAHEAGGALITARLAIEQNREVFAVPTPVDHRRPSGSNRLIRDGHARLIESAEDVLEDLGLRMDQASTAQQTPAPDLSGIERTLYEALGPEPIHIDTLCLTTDVDSSTALVYLLNLEFKGLVRQMAGKQFFRV